MVSVSLTEKKRDYLDDRFPMSVLLETGAPDIRWKKSENVWFALCPFHADKNMGSFSFNLTKGCWKCFTCHAGGSGAYSFIQKVNGWDHKQTVAYLYDKLGPGDGRADPPKIVRKPVEKNSPAEFTPPGYSREKVTPDELDIIYRAFISASPLSDEEWEVLRQTRGLREEDRDTFFRFPSNRDSSFWGRFRLKLDKLYKEDLYPKLLSVPGFYWDIQLQRVGFVGFAGSIGIVNHDPDGRVNGLELRLQSVRHGMRYMPFSSGNKLNGDKICGTSMKNFVDVVQPSPSARRRRGIAVTEGKFKALHLSYQGYLVLNVHGVTNWAKIFPVLEQMGNQKLPVDIVFDADSQFNQAVALQALECGKALFSKGYEVNYLSWPAEYGKGFDDLANNRKLGSCRRIPGSEMFACMESVLSEAS